MSNRLLPESVAPGRQNIVSYEAELAYMGRIIELANLAPYGVSVKIVERIFNFVCSAVFQDAARMNLMYIYSII
jgi:hypothetical protein